MGLSRIGIGDWSLGSSFARGMHPQVPWHVSEGQERLDDVGSKHQKIVVFRIFDCSTLSHPSSLSSISLPACFQDSKQAFSI